MFSAGLKSFGKSLILNFNVKSHAGYASTMQGQSLVARLCSFTDICLVPRVIFLCHHLVIDVGTD